MSLQDLLVVVLEVVDDADIGRGDKVLARLLVAQVEYAQLLVVAEAPVQILHNQANQHQYIVQRHE